MATAEAPAQDAREHHDHPEWLAHHFESPEQQFDAGKLGMWLFLAQEVLFFTGLFVAYTVYRANHPEVFEHAHVFLNPVLGALNTIVLLASSLAIAWGVRAAQKNQQQTLMWMHIFTLACAGFFMGVKVVEYSYKLDEGLVWAGYDDKSDFWKTGLELDANEHALPKLHLTDEGFHTHLFSVMVWSGLIGLATYGYGWANRYSENKVRAWVLIGLGLTILGMAGGIVVGNGIQQIEIDKHAAAGHGDHEEHADHDEHAADQHAEHHDGDGHLTSEEADAMPTEPEPGSEPTPDAEGQEPAGVETAEGEPAEAEGVEAEAERGFMSKAIRSKDDLVATEGRPVNAGNFFSIYFAMTGVHALHIFAGIIAISWIVGRIARGDFGPERYGPVEYTGLYWHLVDLVWIYLFPLLYLIR